MDGRRGARSIHMSESWGRISLTWEESTPQRKSSVLGCLEWGCRCGKEQGFFIWKQWTCEMKRKEACPVTVISFAAQRTGTQKLHVFYLLDVSLAGRCTGVAWSTSTQKNSQTPSQRPSSNSEETNRSFKAQIPAHSLSGTLPGNLTILQSDNGSVKRAIYMDYICMKYSL